MSTYELVNLNMFDGDNLESYHRTAKKGMVVLNTTNPIFLLHYHPTVKSNVDKLNSPLAQFVYNKNKRSAFFNFTDAGKMLAVLNELNENLARFPGKEYTAQTSIGRVRFTARFVWFMENGERYHIPQNEAPSFYRNLLGGLAEFRANKTKGSPYPFYAGELDIDGKHEEVMMLVTHHGDFRHDVPVSFLRYVHSGKAGKLTLRYGNTELFWASYNIEGMPWIKFVEHLHSELLNISKNLDGDNLYFIFKQHPALKKYNTYISTMQSFGKTWLTINTDMAPTNNKVMFMVDEVNMDHLLTFIGGVKYFLQSNKINS